MFLKPSGITLYPTDTVYGLGVDATDPEAVRALIELKGRPDGKPISIVVADMAMAEQYAEVTPLARRLAARFLPGKLTLVLTARNLPDEITAGTGTVGIRIPDHPAPMRLVRELGRPITATSANVAGMPTMGSTPDILAQFGEKASHITRVIDGGTLSGSVSTIVDAQGESPLLIREGAIPFSEIALS